MSSRRNIFICFKWTNFHPPSDYVLYIDAWFFQHVCSLFSVHFPRVVTAIILLVCCLHSTRVVYSSARATDSILLRHARTLTRCGADPVRTMQLRSVVVLVLLLTVIRRWWSWVEFSSRWGSFCIREKTLSFSAQLNVWLSCLDIIFI